jgi:hypothetical protein
MDLDDNAKVSTQELMDMVNQPQLEKKVLGEHELEKLTKITQNKYFDYVKSLRQYASDNNMKVSEAEDSFISTVGKKQYDELAEAQRNAKKAQEKSNTKYESYTSKDIDGTNYREELTTLGQDKKDLAEYNRLYDLISENPEKYPRGSETYDKWEKLSKTVNTMPDGTYQSSHWDENNVLYHVRKQDTKIDNDKTLLIEEIQSDWHQEGRKKGYKDTSLDGAITKAYKELDDFKQPFIKEHGNSFWKGMNQADEAKLKELSDKASELLYKRDKQGSQVPQAPYSKTWHEKAMKDQIAEAVEKDYDRVAWVSGKTSADRYSLSKQVDEIKVSKVNERENRRIFIVGETDIMLDVDKTGKVIRDAGGSLVPKEYLGKNIDDILGKEMSQKIMNSDTKNRTILKGEDLEIGGEGMKGFYDQMLPKWTDKYIKKYDSKVEVKKLLNGQEVWSFKVTDKMKKELKGKGQALYSGVATAATIGATQQEDKK